MKRARSSGPGTGRGCSRLRRALPAKAGIPLPPRRRSKRARATRFPALEIVGFDLLLNQFNRRTSTSRTDYDVSIGPRSGETCAAAGSSTAIRSSSTSSAIPTRDRCTTASRAPPGLGYWSRSATPSRAARWEIAGETTPPSLNDQITSGIGGSFLGEALFRMASLLLETAGRPRGLARARPPLISPATGFNRLAFGDRFDGGVPEPRSRLLQPGCKFGAAGTAQEPRRVDHELSSATSCWRISMDYGLPGKPGYDYERPFDYFSFQATAASGDVLENLITRGLLVGSDYAIGEHYRGIWGLYGSYDYHKRWPACA